MEEKAGAQISTRAFIQSVVILFILMMIAGVLTRLIPAGSFARSEVDGREVIDPASFQYIEQPDYPIWRWFPAPSEVLAAVGRHYPVAGAPVGGGPGSGRGFGPGGSEHGPGMGPGPGGEVVG